MLALSVVTDALSAATVRSSSFPDAAAYPPSPPSLSTSPPNPRHTPVSPPSRPTPYPNTSPYSYSSPTSPSSSPSSNCSPRPCTSSTFPNAFTPRTVRISLSRRLPRRSANRRLYGLFIGLIRKILALGFLEISNCRGLTPRENCCPNYTMNPCYPKQCQNTHRSTHR